MNLTPRPYSYFKPTATGEVTAYEVDHQNWLDEVYNEVRTITGKTIAQLEELHFIPTDDDIPEYAFDELFQNEYTPTQAAEVLLKGEITEWGN